MNENDLISFYSDITDRLWVLAQFWGSVSLGLVALAHFASEKIKGMILYGVIFLYSAYTFSVFAMMRANRIVLDSVVLDLQDLELSGETLSRTGVIVQEAGLGQWEGALWAVVVFSTYLGCVGYVIYAHRNRKAGAN
jgi:hypothetical protein